MCVFTRKSPIALLQDWYNKTMLLKKIKNASLLSQNVNSNNYFTLQCQVLFVCVFVWMKYSYFMCYMLRLYESTIVFWAENDNVQNISWGTKVSIECVSLRFRTSFYLIMTSCFLHYIIQNRHCVCFQVNNEVTEVGKWITYWQFNTKGVKG